MKFFEWVISYRKWFPNKKLPITIKWNRSLQIALVTASLGIGVVVILSSLLRRKRKPRRIIDSKMKMKNSNSILTVAIRESNMRNRGKSPSTCITPLGDGVSGRASVASYKYTHRRSESNSTIASGATLTNNDGLNMTSEYLCETGMDYLLRAIDFWVEALQKIGDLDATNEDVVLESLSENEQYRHILHLIERAYKIRDYYQGNISTLCTDTALNAAIEVLDDAYEAQRKKRSRSRASTITSWDAASSDEDSFVSAEEAADLSDLEDQLEMCQNYAVYEAALLELEHGTIPFRTLRTKTVGCNSDTEFLAKLYCLRIAFDDLFSNPATRQWFAECGKTSLVNILILAERDPDDFIAAFDELIQFITVKDHWTDIEDELKGRGVKSMNFFDIVIDFMLLDAFDDLENPPSSVTSVVNNRWLSDGFKETALATAVWSVLKAKRRMLKYPKGFMAHFYAVTEHVSPVLAWGFLGPSGDLQNSCYIFKDSILDFIFDLFDFHKVHYTLIESLAEDILRLSKHRFKFLLDNLTIST